jgi:hypothetical protein
MDQTESVWGHAARFSDCGDDCLDSITARSFLKKRVILIVGRH